MKTIIFNGSPRKDGETAGLLKLLLPALEGEKTVVDCCAQGIGACVDCRFCHTHEGCCTQGKWPEIDRLIRESDSILLASPVYFEELTGPLLSVCSKIQSYWCARRFQGKELIPKPKRGGILLTAGGEGGFGPPVKMAIRLLHIMNCRDIFPAVCFPGTDTARAVHAQGALERVTRLAGFLNGCRDAAAPRAGTDDGTHPHP